MLSRVADSIFWMSRYMERTKAETTLLSSNFIAIQDNAIILNWHLILEEYGSKKFIETNDINSKNSLIHLILDKNNPSSLSNNVMYGRENARSIQDHITKELWQSLNSFYHFIRSDKNEYLINYEDPLELMDSINNYCYNFYGVLDNTMDRGASYYFMNVGKHLERAIQSLIILSIKLKEIDYKFSDNESISFRYVLQALSGMEFFGKTYRGEVSSQNIIHFVLFNPLFSHSVMYSLERVHNNFKNLKEYSTLETFSTIDYEIGKLISNFTYSNPDLNDAKNLYIYIENLKNQINNLSLLFSKLYFG
jgi:uncharacterized alpha-E superfamily protein